MTVPDTTLDDYQEKQKKEKSRIREMLQRLGGKEPEKQPEESRKEQVVPTVPTGKIEPPSIPPETVVPTQDKLSRLTADNNRKIVLDWVNAHSGNHSVDAVFKNLKLCGYDISKDNAKKILQRLEDDKQITKINIGYWAFYERITTDKQIKIEEISDKVTELEKQLSEALQIDKGKIPQVHKIILVLSKESIQEAIETLGKGGHLPELSITPQDALGVLTNSAHRDSIYQRWSRMALNEKTKPINGGFQENVAISPSSGFIGEMKVQVYENGTLWISFNFSEHPIDLTKWREFEQWLTGFSQSRMGWGFLELTRYIKIAQFEYSIDTVLKNIGGKGSFVFTAKVLGDLIYTRLYSKEIDGQLYERREVGLEEPVPYDLWLQKTQAMMFGGMGMQFAVKQQHELEKFQKTVSDTLTQYGDSIRYLLKDSQQRGISDQRQTEINIKILESLRGRKVGKEPPTPKPVPEAKKPRPPEPSRQTLISNKDDTPKQPQTSLKYRTCECGASVWVARAKCQNCGKELKKEA